jgi:dihydroorotate dehydrogenase (fumarate)
MIGAGVCKTPARAKEWLQVAPVVTGSYTPKPRDGNPGKVMWPETLEEVLAHGYGLNSYGMPNMGTLPARDELATLSGTQPLIVNVAGFSAGDYLTQVTQLAPLGNVAAIELNFGCPNTQGEHGNEDILSFQPDVVRTILNLLSDYGVTKPLWLKFSPYSNPGELRRMAELVNKYVHRLQLAVVTCNTFPNSYAGSGMIDPQKGYAGLSGPAMKPIALGQVKQFRQYLDARIDVIGVGGITCGDDILDFLEADAAAVQLTSLPHWLGDPARFFETLLREETSQRFIDFISNT